MGSLTRILHGYSGGRFFTRSFMGCFKPVIHLAPFGLGLGSQSLRNHSSFVTFLLRCYNQQGLMTLFHGLDGDSSSKQQARMKREKSKTTS